MGTMQDTQFIETRQVTLPRGGILEIQMTQSMINRIKQSFGLSHEQSIDDDHIRMFLWGAVNDAVNKAECGEQNGIETGYS